MRARKVEPVRVSRFVTIVQRLNFSIVPPSAAAICTSRPSSAESGEVAGEIGAADHVEHDIDAAPSREGLGLGDEILRPVIDGEIRAERAAEGAFFVRARRRDHLGAESLGELDRGRADAAGAAMNEQRLAGLEAPAREDVVVDGEEGFRHARRLNQAQAFGNRQAERGGGDAIIGVAAGAEQRADLVADAQARRRPAPSAAMRPDDLEPRHMDSPGGGG